MSAPEKGQFTADNLPEAARSTLLDSVARFDNGMPLNLNGYTARILNRLDAAHNGRLSALLNGTAPAPAFTDEPPEVTWGDVDAAGKVYESNHPGHKDGLMLALRADRARVWQTHRPKPVDPVRFELGKVTDEQWREFIGSIKSVYDCAMFGRPAYSLIIAQLARILPVAEPPKQWAELTDEAAQEIVFAAMNAYNYRQGKKKSPERNAALASSFKQGLYAYAPPPRKVEVTPEVVKAFNVGYRKFKGLVTGHEDYCPRDSAGLRAALAVANQQAEARESEAVAEVARLKGDLEQAEAQLDHANVEIELLRSENAAYETSLQANRDRIVRLTKERDEARAEVLEATRAADRQTDEVMRLAKVERENDEALRARAAKHYEVCNELDALKTHAAKLEALLTVEGVKLWLPFQRRYKIGPVGWEAAELALGYSVGGTPQALFDRVAGGIELRQTPAPEAEVKRWRVRLMRCPDGITLYQPEVTTDAMTRAEAEKIGTVIGEDA